MPKPSCTTIPIPSTSVQPPESPSQLGPLQGGVDGSHPPGIAETFRHSGWARTRRLIYEALKQTMQPVHRIMAFSGCGAFAFVYRTLERPYRYRLGGSSCKDRLCLPCAADRSRVLASNVLAAIADQPVRFLTLTLKHSDSNLDAQLSRIYDCFRRLRSRGFWRRRVNGGCAFLEVTWSAKTHQWHPHLHALLHGKYIDQQHLAKEWLAVTGDSHIVDIRFVRDAKHVAHYVTKYVSKPLSNTFLNRQTHLHEFINAVKGRRLCLTFGDWQHIKLTESPSQFEWQSMGSFHSVILEAIEGAADANLAVYAICGDRIREVCEAVRHARPPPTIRPPADTQIVFQFPPAWIDC